MSFLDFVLKKRGKIGLALSGGATHGAAHIGVLQVLEREGIKPDLITGTSAGAIIGSAYAAGVPLTDIERLFKSADWPKLVRINLAKPIALFDTEPMEEFIRTNVGDCKFEDLPIPFAAIACDIMTGERVVLDRGPLAPAVRASAAIPGLFSPVEIEGRLLVDGGVIDNLPVDQVIKMGANYVIASDLTSTGTLKDRPNNAVEIFMAMIMLMNARSNQLNPVNVQCYIHPDVAEFSAWSFDDGDTLIARGRAAAELEVTTLKKDISKIMPKKKS